MKTAKHDFSYLPISNETFVNKTLNIVVCNQFTIRKIHINAYQ